MKIYELHQQYLVFSLPGKEEGDPDRFLVFLVMPFGLASAVKCITRVTMPLCCYLASKGIRHSIYIDDGNTLARMLVLVLVHLAIVLETLEKAGFIISKKKTDTADTVGQIKIYLGFVIDSKKTEVRVTAEKIQDVRKAISQVTEGNGPSVKVRQVAKAIGKLVAMEAAMGPVVQLLSRAAQAELAQVTEKSWNVYMQLSHKAKEGLVQMAEVFEEYNGYPIKNVVTVRRLDTLVDASNETADKEAPPALLRIDGKQPIVMAGDASAIATCALQVDQEAKDFNQTLLQEKERTLSSGHRELLTVLRALQQDESSSKQWKIRQFCG